MATDMEDFSVISPVTLKKVAKKKNISLREADDNPMQLHSIMGYIT